MLRSHVKTSADMQHGQTPRGVFTLQYLSVANGGCGIS